MSFEMWQVESPERGSIFGGLLGLVFLLLAVVAGVAFFFGEVVYPGYIGVRQITLGPQQGFSSEGLEPGYHWNVPFYSMIHLVPQNIQSLHFDRDKKVAPESLGALDIQTSDGAQVDIDISILTRFYSGPGEDGGLKHGGPADLVQKMSIAPSAWNSNLRQIAEGELRRALGKLSSGEFYDPKGREEKLEMASKAIKARLAPYGIKLEALLLRRFTYRSDRIDNAIFQKNLQNQEERYNEGLSKFSEAKAALEAVSAEWDAKIKTLKVEGENKAKVLVSEADLYEKKKVAEGDLLVAKARAEVDRLRASALSQVWGSDVYVARELAPIVSSLRGGVVTDLDPFDLDMWLKRLGIGGQGVYRPQAAVGDAPAPEAQAAPAQNGAQLPLRPKRRAGIINAPSGVLPAAKAPVIEVPATPPAAEPPAEGGNG